MRVYFYLEEASRYWLLIGTIMLIFGSFRVFELSFSYLMAVLILWGLLVGLPSFIFMKVGRWLEGKSRISKP